MDSERRQAIQQSFMQGDVNCIVATIAFGMGIDKANIRNVIHYDLPKSIENYSQEIGRAGRDGKLSHCTVIANKAGLNTLENFVYGDTPDFEAIAFILDEIKNQPEQWEVMLHRLSKDSNIRVLPLKTLMVYLELHNIIEPQYSYFADYRFKCHQTPQQIAAHFQGERQQFIETIFTCSPKARTWHTVDFDALWDNHQAERKRAVTAIDYLSEKGWIELESKQMTEVYRVVNTHYNTQEQATKLFNLFKQKESSEIERINNMIAFFENKHCLSHDLSHYFADHNAPVQCGHCSVCRGNITTLPVAADLPEITPDTLKNWCDPFISICKTMPSAAALTRFLNGMTSPLNTQVKARQMNGWGQLEAHPFANVRELVSELYSLTP
jgi:ATP-dependent DNA helicase RecQ